MLTRDRGSKSPLRRGRPWSLSTATLVAVAGLVLTLVLATSALVATYVSTYVSGLVLGVGLVGLVWGISASYHRATKPQVRLLGRSQTQDCHLARRRGPALPFEAPRPPTPAQRRVRPCPGYRLR